MSPASIAFDQYIIRPLSKNDVSPYFEMVDRNRDRLSDFFSGTVVNTHSFEETVRFVDGMLERAEARTYFPFLICDKETGRIVGFLDLKNIDWTVPKAETGGYIDRAFSGKSLGTKAFEVFCTHCFTTLGFHKLFFRTHISNTAARRIAEHSGFVQEGVMRSDYRTSSGELVDLLYFGRLKDL